ncbi:hypothetical protein L1887_08858 [Cichorium endivia]|nr:hypothetical protein L1887_08858 [Cichorium endivia]
MEGVESKVESQGQDSHTTLENVEVIAIELSGKLGFPQHDKEILNMIEQDENISEMTVEICGCNMSILTILVTELSVEADFVFLQEKAQILPSHHHQVPIQSLSCLWTNENALQQTAKTNVVEPKLMISESNCKIETMEKVIEASRKQVLTVD